MASRVKTPSKGTFSEQSSEPGTPKSKNTNSKYKGKDVNSLLGIPSQETCPLAIPESKVNMKDQMLEQIIARLRKSILQKEEINNKDLKK